MVEVFPFHQIHLNTSRHSLWLAEFLLKNPLIALCEVLCMLFIASLVAFGLPKAGGTVVKNPPVNAGDVDSIPGSGRSPGVGNGNPLQYSCLGNSME